MRIRGPDCRAVRRQTADRWTRNVHLPVVSVFFYLVSTNSLSHRQRNEWDFHTYPRVLDGDYRDIVIITVGPPSHLCLCRWSHGSRFFFFNI